MESGRRVHSVPLLPVLITRTIDVSIIWTKASCEVATALMIRLQTPSWQAIVAASIRTEAARHVLPWCPERKIQKRPLRSAGHSHLVLRVTGNVRCDAAIYQPFERPDRAINSVACKPSRPKIEAAFDALDHGLGDGDLRDTVGTFASASTMIPALLSIR
jgi:hypothetical protein